MRRSQKEDVQIEMQAVQNPPQGQQQAAAAPPVQQAELLPLVAALTNSEQVSQETAGAKAGRTAHRRVYLICG